jgi:hypothetical protein
MTESLYPDGRFYGAGADDSIVIDDESIDLSLDDDGDLISGVLHPWSNPKGQDVLTKL